MYLTSPRRPPDIDLSWARPVVLVAGKGRGGRFLFLVSSLSFIFLSPLSLSFITTTISFYLSSPSL